jgi:hypothetical protein
VEGQPFIDRLRTHLQAAAKMADDGFPDRRVQRIYARTTFWTGIPGQERLVFGLASGVLHSLRGLAPVMVQRQ